MIKILYAAGNSENGKISLARFMQAMAGKPYIIKVAAYKKSSPKGMNIDWTLDALLNVFKPDNISLENENVSIYYDQVKYYKPDLVISDLEYFTSYIANLLGVSVWQCSSSLINFAVEQKYNLGLFKKYSYLLGKNNPLRTQRQINIIDNSDLNLVYSHLGDTQEPPSLKEKYEWVRPYHTVGKKSIPCQHNLVAGLLYNDKRVLALLKRYSDCVAFTDFPHEQYTDLQLKDIRNQEEYFCNLRNCNLFVCEGQTSFLADAFYNNKYSVVMTNFHDTECVINSIFSEHLGLSSLIYQIEDDLETFLNRQVEPLYNEKILYLHEAIANIA